MQLLYKLSDDEMEFQILDRRSFQKFLGIQEYERIPDSKTIWAFKERLREEKLDKVLFHKLTLKIEGKGF
ncbi:MAG: transposase [Leptospiraceae bacterium]|nr:transposase [Leptospiraceae bacterium]